MPAYKVSYDRVVRIAGSMAEVRTHRQEIVDNWGIKKADVSVEEIELPKGKAGLLEFVNGLLAEHADPQD